MRKMLAALAAVLVVASGAQAGRVDVDRAIASKFGAHARTAVCISHAEDPNRGVATVSPTNDHGVFQIHVPYGAGGVWLGTGRWRTYFTIAQLDTLAGNLRAASILSNHGAQWRAWTGTYARGMCQGLG